MKARAIVVRDPVPYAKGVALQESILAARLDETIGDTVLFLEHLPVVTLGRRGRENYLLTAPEVLRDAGIDFYRSSRGGDVTYHAPGQLIMYPILRLGSHEADARGYLHNLEEVAIRTAASFGIEAWRRENKNGAWTHEGKISAIGFRLKRWITQHGMSFNVDLDLDGFKHIVPCGLENEPVTSLRACMKTHAPSVGEVREGMMGHFDEVFGRSLQPIPVTSFEDAYEHIGCSKC